MKTLLFVMLMGWPVAAQAASATVNEAVLADLRRQSDLSYAAILADGVRPGSSTAGAGGQRRLAALYRVRRTPVGGRSATDRHHRSGMDIVALQAVSSGAWFG